jgi:hypothetical protein
MHKYIQIHIHTYTYIYIHTHPHIHTHTHTHVSVPGKQLHTEGSNHRDLESLGPRPDLVGPAC